ncbi:Ricin B-like lectin [Glarea lozoyensis ATCC 20868]|uniref:Ricin B-like lectin n=1 Tax=Glarea lozoyensis (strain ATCC 20868 / MF5171) TaxID=1116229 RepID=S3CWH6_GLAL2|nr:Ricin B-like lectin [Glarea lozoyensis ATCC 20868]EPE30727.1 Ricin B-like lectin [Glarea lozoyensis ATCC 20868]
MLATSILLVALAAVGLAEPPAGYRTVYITSLQDAKFVITPKAAKNGSTTVVQTLTKKPEQQWYIKAGNTTIQLANTTLCLDGGPKSNWKDMGNIYLIDCAPGKVSQQWDAMADGRIALKPSSPAECIDLQYLRATQNNPVGLYACAGLANSGAADKGINWPLVNVTTT